MDKKCDAILKRLKNGDITLGIKKKFNFPKILEQSLGKSTKDNLNKNSGAFKVPLKLHHVWIVDPNNPRSFSLSTNTDQALYNKDLSDSKDFNLHIKKAIQLREDIYIHDDKIKHSNFDWKHYLWTNMKSFPSKVASELKKRSIVVKNIGDPEYGDAVFKKGMEYVKGLIIAKQYGTAIDLTKYLALYAEGGVYYDMNFMMRDLPINIMKNFDFFATAHNNYHKTNAYVLAPNLIGSAKYHPVMEGAINLIADKIVGMSKQSFAKVYTEIVPQCKHWYANPGILTSYVGVVSLSESYYEHYDSNPNNKMTIVPWHYVSYCYVMKNDDICAKTSKSKTDLFYLTMYKITNSSFENSSNDKLLKDLCAPKPIDCSSVDLGYDHQDNTWAELMGHSVHDEL